MIDYRSDTVTRPGAEMLEAMRNAPVGDDVFGEDPTVNQLQEYAASMFGMEAALYCPSGTMTNQIAIKVHTRPGDEVICESHSHIYVYEGGGIAFNSGCQVKLIPGDYGRITAGQILESINPDDVHKPRTRLVGLENTSNRGGGSCYDFEEILKIRKVCTENNLKFHLDGARLFNALVAKGNTPAEYGKIFDSISICLSKGLGAPVGSLLLGTKEFIDQARRIRKVFGGGMRQAGIIAAGGLYALKNNIERLGIDHSHATAIADTLREKEFVTEIFPVETNIIIFGVGGKYSAKSLAEEFGKNGIKVIAISPTRIRIVTHLDISSEMVEKTVNLIRSL
ncbi:MAG: aminotransferase class I/II-fold pyridoxal phosphate-dependent enzyme [Chitinophagaceae bacterium]|nr:aminotransferase class I/II-fold pyridoxal phosphate-dependent enzyme [Chitinophagaceae bacterium]